MLMLKQFYQLSEVKDSVKHFKRTQSKMDIFIRQ